MTDYARLYQEALAEIDALTALVVHQTIVIMTERTRANAYRAAYAAMLAQCRHHKAHHEMIETMWRNGDIVIPAVRKNGEK